MVEDLGCGCWAGEKVGGVVAKAGEGGKDIFDVVSFDAIKKEIRGIEFSHKVEAFRIIPFVNGRFETRGLGQRNHIVARAGQFQNTVGNPFLKRLLFVPQTFLFVEIRRKHRQLDRKSVV